MTPPAGALTMERLIPSPPERLFALWTEPEALTRWWAPDGYQAEVVLLDPRPGGAWRIVLRSPDGRAAGMGGVYKVVERPRRLVFTWIWDNDPAQETEVTATFEAAPGGARLALAHRRFASAEARKRHDAGWVAALDRLAQTT